MSTPIHEHTDTKYVDGWFVASCDCGYTYGGMTRDEADNRLFDHIERADLERLYRRSGPGHDAE